jgi:serine/threonine-protein kinase RsbW
MKSAASHVPHVSAAENSLNKYDLHDSYRANPSDQADRGERGDRTERGNLDERAGRGDRTEQAGRGGRERAGGHERGHLATAADPAAAVSTAARPVTRDEVTVKMPADGVYLSVLRTATAGLAARLDFTLDEIEDMRIAVDEACAILLSQAIPGSDLECRFSLGQDAITIFVSVRCVEPRVPADDTFAWTVLTALAGRVDAEVGPGDLLTFVLRKSRDSSRSV